MHRIVALDRKLSARLAISCEARFLRLLALIAAHSGDSLLWLLGALVALIWGNAAWWGFGGRVLIGTLAVTGVILAFVVRHARRRLKEKEGGSEAE